MVKPPHRTVSCLLDTPLAGAEYLHIGPPFSPEDLAEFLAELTQRADTEWRPRIVFEPSPPSCHSGQREWLERVASGVEILSYASSLGLEATDALSPNHEELLSFYSYPTSSLPRPV